MAPTSEDLDAYYGLVEEPKASEEPQGEPKKEEKPLPSLSDVEKRIPEKTKALMEELFRARLETVKRIDPKEVR